MVTNAAARKIRVFIGSDQQDWSLCIRNFVSGYESLSGSGLIKQFGSLEILNVDAAPESIDPRSNPGRWRENQVVRVEALNDAGSDWIAVGQYLAGGHRGLERRQGKLYSALSFFVMIAPTTVNLQKFIHNAPA